MKSSPILDPDITYRNKEWIIDRYVVNLRTVEEMAIECNVSKKTILNWKGKFNIKNVNVKDRNFNRGSNFSEEEIKERKRVGKKKFRIEHKEEIKKYNKYYKEKHKEELKQKRAAYLESDIGKKRVAESSHKCYFKDANRHRNHAKEYRKKLRSKLFLIIGNKCIKCGISDSRVLTFDHINNDGYLDRARTGSSIGIISELSRMGWPEEYIKNKFQTMCYNCNCTKDKRSYYDKPISEINLRQKKSIELWESAFNFFGPCELCGESNLKYLTIDHKNRDGAEKRKNGEYTGYSLLKEFKKLGWPESLKDTYRILCYNCNCGIVR